MTDATPSMAMLAQTFERAQEVKRKREACPRAATLLDEVQALIDKLPKRTESDDEPKVFKRECLTLAEALLEHNIDRGQEITDEDEGYVRDLMAKEA